MGRKKKAGILIVSQELKPFAEFTGASHHIKNLLPLLKAEGYDVRIITPRYPFINVVRHGLRQIVRLSRIPIMMNGHEVNLCTRGLTLPDLKFQIYFVEPDGDSLPDDPLLTASFLAHSSLTILRRLFWTPHIIHCFGWVAALTLSPLHSSSHPLKSASIISIYEKHTGMDDLISHALPYLNHYRKIIIASPHIGKDIRDFIERSAGPLLALQINECQNQSEFLLKHLSIYRELCP